MKTIPATKSLVISTITGIVIDIPNALNI
jgi:hypothetical protein